MGVRRYRKGILTNNTCSGELVPSERTLELQSPIALPSLGFHGAGINRNNGLPYKPASLGNVRSECE